MSARKVTCMPGGGHRRDTDGDTATALTSEQGVVPPRPLQPRGLAARLVPAEGRLKPRGAGCARPHGDRPVTSLRVPRSHRGV